MAFPVLITTLFLLLPLLPQTSMSSPVQDPELVVQEVHKYEILKFITFQYLNVRIIYINYVSYIN